MMSDCPMTVSSARKVRAGHKRKRRSTAAEFRSLHSRRDWHRVRTNTRRRTARNVSSLDNQFRRLTPSADLAGPIRDAVVPVAARSHHRAVRGDAKRRDGIDDVALLEGRERLEDDAAAKRVTDEPNRLDALIDGGLDEVGECSAGIRCVL